MAETTAGEFWAIFKGIVVVIMIAFGCGAAWGACQVGATMVRRLAE